MESELERKLRRYGRKLQGQITRKMLSNLQHTLQDEGVRALRRTFQLQHGLIPIYEQVYNIVWSKNPTSISQVVSKCRRIVGRIPCLQ